MRIQLKKIFLLSIIYILLGCNHTKEQKITINKVEGSPSYNNSKISLVEQTNLENNFNFSFELEEYELGIQTEKEFEYQLANSEKG